MKSRNPTLWNRATLTTVLSVVTLCTALAGDARASCFTTGGKNPLPSGKTQFTATAAAAGVDDDSDSASIVGMWNAEYLIGSGPDLFDESFQQFHSDGTEMMLSRGLPPALGNVCVGVWKQAGRTIKLKHVAWNWNADGSWAGTFIMEVTLTVSRRGTRYSGTWVSDNLDTMGNPIAGGHFEGVVRASRISVD